MRGDILTLMLDAARQFVERYWGRPHAVLVELAGTSIDPSFAPLETKGMLRRELEALVKPRCRAGKDG